MNFYHHFTVTFKTTLAMKYIDVEKLKAEINNRLMAVDIEKELEEAVRRYKPNGDFGWGTLYNIAYYFYELGLNARKEE